MFRQVAEGFRCADLRQHLAALSGRDPQSISPGAITYRLRRLRLHGMIERLPKSFRYRVTATGLRAALFFTRAYNRLLRPGIATAIPTVGAVTTPLKRAFDNVGTQINRTPDSKLDTFTLSGPTQAGLDHPISPRRLDQRDAGRFSVRPVAARPSLGGCRGR